MISTNFDVSFPHPRSVIHTSSNYKNSPRELPFPRGYAFKHFNFSLNQKSISKIEQSAFVVTFTYLMTYLPLFSYVKLVSVLTPFT